MTGAAARSVTAVARALAQMALYGAGHPTRDRAVDQAHEALAELMTTDPQPRFTFLADEVLYGDRRLDELSGWDWARRLEAVGVERLEITGPVSREDLEAFLEEVFARMTGSPPDTSETRAERPARIRFGTVGLRGETAPAPALPTATISYSLVEEAETIRWLHEEVAARGRLPLLEAEAVVGSLAVAMHAGRRIMLPLVRLKTFDEYTTSHSLNVAVLSMALAEFMGLGAADVRNLGIAGLLHDLGKIRIPREVLTKPGRLTDEERLLMNTHPAEGARLILEAAEQLDLAATVAYEHHVMLNGGGYPTFRFPRSCHHASRLVHVCDVYDALRTKRPYRDAWSQGRVVNYLKERAGLEFDPEVVDPFLAMMRKSEPQVILLGEEESVPGGGPGLLPLDAPEDLR